MLISIKNLSFKQKQSVAFYLKAAVLLVAAAAMGAGSYADSVIQDFSPESGDRILILAPHPDDESLCCGGMIQESVQKNAQVKIVFLTHGDDNEWSFLISEKKPVLTSGQAVKMGMIRSEEALQAGRVLGIPEEDIIFLGYPDSGMLPMWNRHWKSGIPYSGFLTKADSVPYKNALRPGVPYTGEEVLKDLKTILRDFNPTKVFVSHPADRNGDHRALYFFTRVALWDLNLQPKIYPYLIHHRKWPKPRGYDPHQMMRPPKSLSDRIEWSRFRLTAEQTGLKYKAVQKHRTQMSYSKRFMSSFVRGSEIFGDFKDILLGESSDVKGMNSDPRNSGKWEDRLTEEIEDLFLRKDLVTLESGNIVIRVNLTSLLSGTLKLGVSVYGYRSGTPFSDMPKLNIRCGIADCEVYDGFRRLENSAVKIEKKPGYIAIRIPQKAAGDAQRIFIGMSTLLGDRTIKVLPGRIFTLSEDG